MVLVASSISLLMLFLSVNDRKNINTKQTMYKYLSVAKILFCNLRVLSYFLV
jgi:hypothetical protein